MKVVPRRNLVYSFSSQCKPVECIKPRKLVLFETEDALGGKSKTRRLPYKSLTGQELMGQQVLCSLSTRSQGTH